MFLAWIELDGQIESIIIHGLKGENTVNCRDGNWENVSILKSYCYE